MFHASEVPDGQASQLEIERLQNCKRKSQFLSVCLFISGPKKIIFPTISEKEN